MGEKIIIKFVNNNLHIELLYDEYIRGHGKKTSNLYYILYCAGGGRKNNGPNRDIVNNIVYKLLCKKDVSTIYILFIISS